MFAPISYVRSDKIMFAPIRYMFVRILSRSYVVSSHCVRNPYMSFEQVVTPFLNRLEDLDPHPDESDEQWKSRINPNQLRLLNSQWSALPRKGKEDIDQWRRRLQDVIIRSRRKRARYETILSILLANSVRVSSPDTVYRDNEKNAKRMALNRLK